MESGIHVHDFWLSLLRPTYINLLSWGILGNIMGAWIATSCWFFKDFSWLMDLTLWSSVNTCFLLCVNFLDSAIFLGDFTLRFSIFVPCTQWWILMRCLLHIITNSPIYKILRRMAYLMRLQIMRTSFLHKRNRFINADTHFWFEHCLIILLIRQLIVHHSTTSFIQWRWLCILLLVHIFP
jgi:hypothetical protein